MSVITDNMLFKYRRNIKLLFTTLHKSNCCVFRRQKLHNIITFSHLLHKPSATVSATFLFLRYQRKANFCLAVENPHYLNVKNSDMLLELSQNMLVFDDFLSEEDEISLMKEIEPHIKRLRYEVDHWDNAIHGYRETEKSNWNSKNQAIIQRVRDKAFPPGTPQLHHVHVLDLAQSGIINPHVDSIKFCGNTIAGLSLLSTAVMRLAKESDQEAFADVLLQRRSLYIMRGPARYNYTHAILGGQDSVFRGQPVVKDRRVSVICRNEPSQD